MDKSENSIQESWAGDRHSPCSIPPPEQLQDSNEAHGINGAEKALLPGQARKRESFYKTMLALLTSVKAAYRTVRRQVNTLRKTMNSESTFRENDRKLLKLAKAIATIYDKT